MTLPPTSLSVDPEVCVPRDGQAEKSQPSQGFWLDSVTAVDVTCSVVIIGQPVCSPGSCTLPEWTSQSLSCQDRTTQP